MFPGGHPSKYYPDPTLLNFADRTRSGAFNVVWPLATEHSEIPVFMVLSQHKYGKYHKFYSSLICHMQKIKHNTHAAIAKTALDVFIIE